MSTSVGQAIVSIEADYRRSLIGPDDARAQMSFALFKMMDSGRPFYSWDVLHHYFADIYQPQGIGMIPWTVVRGFSNEFAREEGRQAGIYSTAVQGCVLVDLEDDPKFFWQGIESAVDAWIQGFVEGGGREVFLWPDSRKDKLKGENFWRWWHYKIVTRVWPQAYFSIFFSAGARDRVRRGIDRAVQPLVEGGIPMNAITPTLMTSDNDGNPIPWPELLEGILYCRELGANGFSLWRRQFLSPEQRDGLAALADPFAPPPSRRPRAQRNALTDLSDLERAVGRLNAHRLETLHATEDALGLTAPGNRAARALATDGLLAPKPGSPDSAPAPPARTNRPPPTTRAATKLIPRDRGETD